MLGSGTVALFSTDEQIYLRELNIAIDAQKKRKGEFLCEGDSVFEMEAKFAR